MRFGFVLALLLVAGSCSDGKTCSNDAECARGQICGGAGTGPFHCLDACDANGGCRPGFACENVTTAVCLVCDVVTRACVLQPPAPR